MAKQSTPRPGVEPQASLKTFAIVGANSFARFYPKALQETEGETRKEKDQRE
jgi:hypothetical protein